MLKTLLFTIWISESIKRSDAPRAIFAAKLAASAFEKKGAVVSSKTSKPESISD